MPFDSDGALGRLHRPSTHPTHRPILEAPWVSAETLEWHRWHRPLHPARAVRAKRSPERRAARRSSTDAGSEATCGNQLTQILVHDQARLREAASEPLRMV